METSLPVPAPPPAPASDAPPPEGWAVPAGRGLDWWSSAWRMFTGAPVPWLVITVVYLAVIFALSMIPFLGQFAFSLLHPLFIGGIVLGCREQDRGGALAVAHLFGGFSEKLGPLVILSLLNFAGWLAIGFIAVALVMMAIGGSALTVLASVLASGDVVQAGFAALSAISLGALLVILVCTLLVAPLLMAFWFAPPLIVLRGDEPVAAMAASLRACLRNVAPFLVYGLLGIAFVVLASIPLALGLLSFVLLVIGWILFLLGLLVLFPVGIATIYTSYKDVFGVPPAAPAG